MRGCKCSGNDYSDGDHGNEYELHSSVKRKKQFELHK